MAERTRGWENCRPVRSILTRPSCSAGARVCAPGPAPWLAAALRSGPSATAASSSAACAGSGRVANREVMTAVSRSVRRQRLGGPAPAGGGIVGDHLGQLDQRHRITGRLGEHLRPGPAAGRAGLPVQQAAGVCRGQRLQVQFGEAAVKAGGRGLPPGADQQHDPFGVQAAAGEGQRVQRAAVQPVGVVGDHQDRGPFGQIRQQGQDGDPGQQRVREATGVRRQAERPQQRLGLPAGKAGGAGQHRPQQLMQPGEREFGLRFPAGDRQHPHPRRPGPAGGVRQQHGLAHPRLTGDQQHPAGLRDRIHQPAQPGQPSLPADDAARAAARRVHRGLACACPLGQCVHQCRPQAKQRPQTGHARSAQSAVTRRIAQSCQAEPRRDPGPARPPAAGFPRRTTVMASWAYPAIRSNSLPSMSAKVVHGTCLAGVAEPLGAQAQQALGLGVEGVADEVEVQAVLDGLRLRHLVERDTWPAGVAVAGEQDHVLGSGVFGNLPPEDIGPEPGQGRRRRRSQR